eukprot:gene33452-40470_t
MAGRGCTITIKLLGSLGPGSVEDISLPVALHSPLIVLKQELAEFVAIRPADQVLILCDLSDPDRNSDVLLTGRDDFTLSECGVRNGSILTLHALGMSAEMRQAISKVALSDPKESVVEDKHRFELFTPIGPELADHSYNGIIFDVEARGPFEVTLTSVSVAGMLGRVRVYARNVGWEEGPPSTNTTAHWWAHRESLNRDGWELVTDTRARPSWDKLTTVPFGTPVVILPHCRRAIYVHSSLPDDLGIQYQSYRKRDIVALSEHILIHPGLGTGTIVAIVEDAEFINVVSSHLSIKENELKLTIGLQNCGNRGHTGSIPFDEVGGWYRSYRGPAGSLGYRGVRKGWVWTNHSIFPQELRQGLRCALLCHVKSRTGAYGGGRRGLGSLPLYVLYYIFEFMHWDWFEEAKPLADEEEDVQAQQAPVQTRRSNLASNLLQLMHLLGGGGGVAHDDDSEEHDGDNVWGDEDEEDDEEDEDEDGEWVDMDEDEEDEEEDEEDDENGHGEEDGGDEGDDDNNDGEDSAINGDGEDDSQDDK